MLLSNSSTVGCCRPFHLHERDGGYLTYTAHKSCWMVVSIAPVRKPIPSELFPYPRLSLQPCLHRQLHHKSHLSLIFCLLCLSFENFQHVFHRHLPSISPFWTKSKGHEHYKRYKHDTLTSSKNSAAISTEKVPCSSSHTFAISLSGRCSYRVS